MKIVIITAPMMQPDRLKAKQYPVDGNKSIEYEKEVRCPINGILAKTLKKDDDVKIIYIMTTGKTVIASRIKQHLFLNWKILIKISALHLLTILSTFLLNLQKKLTIF